MKSQMQEPNILKGKNVGNFYCCLAKAEYLGHSITAIKSNTVIHCPLHYDVMYMLPI